MKDRKKDAYERRMNERKKPKRDRKDEQNLWTATQSLASRALVLWRKLLPKRKNVYHAAVCI